MTTKTSLPTITEHIINIFNTYLTSRKQSTISKLLRLNARNQNFPSEVSEYLTKKVLTKAWEVSMNDIHKGKVGDLVSDKFKSKIEVKCFSSNAPVSFGARKMGCACVGRCP